MRAPVLFAALAAVLMPAAAMADDPHDPAMRTRAARERDRQQIRQMNLDQLAYVRQRDAGYARGWSDWRASRDAGGADAGYAARSADHRRALDDYADSRARYERDMAAWRRAVAACRAGDYSACD
jgi:hypothetical protein